MKNEILKQATELKRQASEYINAWEFDKAMKTLQKMSDLLGKHNIQFKEIVE